MPVLKNKKHEAFARAVANGQQQSAAYREHIATTGDDKSIWEGASGLAFKVRSRISELRAKIDAASETEFIIGAVETQQILSRAIRTPLSCLPEDSDLISARTTRIECSADKDCQDAWEVTKVETIDKLGAIKELNKMRGRYAKEEVEHGGKIEIVFVEQ